MSTSAPNLQRPAIKVFVATTVMLTFISFWRAAAIVLSDLASSAYYVGGDAEKVIGKSAPWFVLAVMLFSYAVRSSTSSPAACSCAAASTASSRRPWAATLAKLSVSALLFDYVLTGPISAVSAGQYLAGFLTRHAFTTSAHDIHDARRIPSPPLSASLVTVYFWWKNIQGIHESSEQALRIMQITTVMVVMLIVWCLITLIMHPAPTCRRCPPRPTCTTNHESLGWLWHMGGEPSAGSCCWSASATPCWP